MADIYQVLPEVQGDELQYIDNLLKNSDNETAQKFANIYRTRRKDPQFILLMALIGFLGVAGVQRFYLDQIGMGLIYLFTGGLCMIGTIVDIVTYKNLAFEFNCRQAADVAQVMKIS